VSFLVESSSKQRISEFAFAQTGQPFPSWPSYRYPSRLVQPSSVAVAVPDPVAVAVADAVSEGADVGGSVRGGTFVGAFVGSFAFVGAFVID